MLSFIMKVSIAEASLRVAFMPPSGTGATGTGSSRLVRLMTCRPLSLGETAAT